jgi:hypothetical protein
MAIVAASLVNKSVSEVAMMTLKPLFPSFARMVLGLCLTLSPQLAHAKPDAKSEPKLTVIMAGTEPGYSLSGVSLGMTPLEVTIALMGRYPDELPSLQAQYKVSTPTYCERHQTYIYPDYRRADSVPVAVPCETMVPGTLSDDRGYVTVETWYRADEFRPSSYVARLSRSDGVYVISVWFSERVDVSLSKPSVSAAASRIEVRFMNPEPDRADRERFYNEAVRKFGPPIATKTAARKASYRRSHAARDAIWCLNAASPQAGVACGGAPYLRMSADARQLQLIDQTDYDGRINAYLAWQAGETRRPQF